MKKGKVYKRGTRAFSVEEIAAGKVEAPNVGKMYDEQYKGRTFVKPEDGRRNVKITEDKRLDNYKGIRQTKKHENSSAFGEPLNIETNFDKKAYAESQSDE